MDIVMSLTTPHPPRHGLSMTVHCPALDQSQDEQPCLCQSGLQAWLPWNNMHRGPNRDVNVALVSSEAGPVSQH